MYPLIRLLTISIAALRNGKMPAEAVCESIFRCRPWDLDMFREMNNGRVLTLYDLGRFDLSIRTGLAKALKQNQWGLVVAGSSIRYRRRVKVFDKVTIRTQIAGFEGSWTYIIQSMWVKRRPTSSVLLRTGVTSQGKVIDTDLVLNALG
ncbi:MAG: acyl-CoA thioesterase, partial [Candidatus Thiodiazotropha sp. (ex Notomyrtea botanica)]|nr:acyl-CoA thioesterase [Candidatus Thiodiazotropha sp. (ex Notomyrtea botanica)]